MPRHVPGKPRLNPRPAHETEGSSRLPPWKKCSLPGRAAGLIPSMPCALIRFEDESKQMLHPYVSSLEGPSPTSFFSTWRMRNLPLQRWVPISRRGSAAWTPRGVHYTSGTSVGGTFAFPYPLCRWLLNLVCLFQQLAFHQKQPGWEMNGYVWSWMKYFAQHPPTHTPTHPHTKPPPTNWAEMD